MCVQLSQHCFSHRPLCAQNKLVLTVSIISSGGGNGDCLHLQTVLPGLRFCHQIYKSFQMLAALQHTVK